MTGEENKLIAEYNDRRVAIESMLRTEGYTLLQGMLIDTEKAAYQAMQSANDGFNCAKHMGAYHVAKNLKSWADRELQVIQFRIHAIQEAALARSTR